MREVIKVSVSGIAFTFEQGAFEVMNVYLKKLEAGYSNNPDGREIIADIEARIAELILTEQDGESVVTKELAENIVNQLGFPDDMGPGVEMPVEDFPRRLYRNPDGAKIGGVCSGLGSYFKTDPVWFRLGFFAPLLLVIILSVTPFRGMCGFFGTMFGMFVLLYFILWIAIPMARNPRQKLEMRGEKITASSIRQEFEEDAQAVSSSPKGKRSASVWADIMYTFGRILQFFLKAILVIIAFAFAVAALAIFVSIIVMFVTGELFLSGYTLDTLAGLEGISVTAYVVLVLLAVLIPMVVIVYLLIRLLFGSKTNRSFLTIMGVVWLMILVYVTVMTTRNAEKIRYNTRHAIESFEYWEDRFEDKLEKRLEYWSDTDIWEEYYENDWDDEGVSVRIENDGRTVTINKVKVNPANPADTISNETITIREGNRQ